MSGQSGASASGPSSAPCCRRADLRDERITEIELASRYGNVTIAAHGFVDASGDAALTWQAGLPCWVPERPIYGSQQVIVENVDESHKPDWGEIDALLAARGDEHGLLRRGGLAFFFPGRGTAVLNVTHIEAPLDPVAASQAQFDGRDQADAVIALLRSEFPKAFGEARVRAYGYPGRRQTRWIKGRHQLTTDQVRHGTWFEDAVARTAWPIELHDRSDGYVWEMFGPDHVHYVPLRAMTPPGAHNLVAAGRCVDGDAAALSSVRVMGPCAAMGAGAAHALDLAGRGSVHEVDLDRLRGRLAANLAGNGEAGHDPHRRGEADAGRRRGRRHRRRDGSAHPLRRRAGLRPAMRRAQRRGHHDSALPGEGAAGTRGRLGQGVRGHQPGLRHRHQGARHAGADLPAAARLRPRRRAASSPTRPSASSCSRTPSPSTAAAA